MEFTKQYIEDVQEYEIEYSAVLPLDVKQVDVNTFGCSGSYSIELLCECHFPRIYGIESNPIIIVFLDGACGPNQHEQATFRIEIVVIV